MKKSVGTDKVFSFQSKWSFIKSSNSHMKFTDYVISLLFFFSGLFLLWTHWHSSPHIAKMFLNIQNSSCLFPVELNPYLGTTRTHKLIVTLKAVVPMVKRRVKRKRRMKVRAVFAMLSSSSSLVLIQWSLGSYRNSGYSVQ